MRSRQSATSVISRLLGRASNSDEARDRHDSWSAFSHGESGLELIDRLDEKLSRSLSQANESHWKWVFASFPDGLCLTDAAGNIRHSNMAFDALLSLEEADREKSIDEILLAQFSRGAEDVRNRLVRGMTVCSAELWRTDEPDGGILRLNCSPFHNDDGRNEGLLWCLRDVTQQKLADEMRNQFVFTATHELRTPLANLHAYAEMLTLKENADIDVEKQKEFCNIIRSEAGRLARLVDELLNISQMEGGGLSIVRKDVDLERLLKDAVSNVESEMDRNQQTFEFLPPAKYPKLKGDREKLASALVNLLGNASKYTPQGGHIRFVAELTDGHIQLHVEDTGFGIPEEELSRVFDKFFRSDDERVRDKPGNGLGLAFTHEVTRLHGGSVTVKSEVNKGSRFTMTLPVI